MGRIQHVRLLLAGVCAALAGAACEPASTPPVVDPWLLELDADNMILGMDHEMTQGGVRNAHLYADTAYYYTDSTAYQLRGLRLVVYTVTGAERGTLTAERGVLDEESEAMVARGNVVLVLPQSNRRLETTELHYDPATEKIWSDSATVFTDGSATTRGSGFDSDLEFTNVQVRNATTSGGRVIRF